MPASSMASGSGYPEILERFRGPTAGMPQQNKTTLDDLQLSTSESEAETDT